MKSPQADAFPGAGELRRRCVELQKRMDDLDLDGVLLYQNADLLYFCGTTQAEAVFVPRLADPVVLAWPPMARVKDETALPRVEPMPQSKDFKALLDRFAARKVKRVGLELDVLPVNFFRRLAGGALAGMETPDASTIIHRVRSIKSEFEISLMKKAARGLDAAFQQAPSIMAKGISETVLEGRMAAIAREHGHQGLVRTRGFNMEMTMGHILSSENGLVQAKVNSPTGGPGGGPGFGQGAGPRVIGRNELVSIDICGTYGGYIVDQARLFFTGPVPDAVKQAYEALLQVVEGVKRVIRPGALAGDVYDRAFVLAEQHGILQNFMKLGGVVCPFVGHGVGLELDEWPALARGGRTPLDIGMTFAFEPRVFLQDFGVVGLEDTFVLTEDGPEHISISNREIVRVDMEV